MKASDDKLSDDTTRMIPSAVACGPMFSAESGLEFQQIKAVDLYLDTQLGGHFHLYNERFFLQSGSANFELEDVVTKANRSVGMLAGDVLHINPGVAHKVQLSKGALLIGSTTEPYVAPEINDHPYDF